MAKMNVKLATESLGSPSGSSKLSPTQFNSGSAVAAAGKSVNINTNAANVKYSPMTPNTIQQDMLGAAIAGGAELSVVHEQAAFQYNERNEESQAKEAVVAYSAMVREGWEGTVGADGRVTGGFKNTKSGQAPNGHQAYLQSLQQTQKDALMALPEGVRKKAALRFSAITQDNMNMASSHTVEQQKVQAQEADYSAAQGIRAQINSSGGAVVFNGQQIKDYAANFSGTQEELDAEIANLGIATVDTMYNKTMAGSDTMDPIEGFDAAQAEYEAIKDKLPPEAQEKVEGWLVGKQQQAVNERKKNNDKILAQTRANHTYDSPANMSTLITSGDPADTSALQIEFDKVKGAYTDIGPDGNPYMTVASKKAVIGIMENSVLMAMNNPANITITQKDAAVDKAMGMLNNIAESNLTPIEAMRFGQQGEVFKGKALSRQAATDTNDMAVLVAGFDIDNIGKMELPKGALDKNKEVFSKMKAAFVKRTAIDGKLSATEDGAWKVSGSTYASIQRDRVLSQTELDDAARLVGDNLMDPQDYFKLVEINSKKSKGQNTKQAYESGAGYKGAMSTIKDFQKQGLFTGKELEKEDENYSLNIGVNTLRATLAENALREHAASLPEGADVDTVKWWTDYQSNLQVEPTAEELNIVKTLYKYNLASWGARLGSAVIPETVNTIKGVSRVGYSLGKDLYNADFLNPENPRPRSPMPGRDN